jgi:hypothetical protein
MDPVGFESFYKVVLITVNKLILSISPLLSNLYFKFLLPLFINFTYISLDIT